MVLLLSRWRMGAYPMGLLAMSFFIAQSSATHLLTVPTQQPQAQQPQAQQPAIQSGARAQPQIDPEIRAKIGDELKQKKFDEAIADAKTILEKDPESPQANKLVGVVLLDAQKPADALTYFQKAQSLDSGEASVHELLLQAYAGMGDKAQRDEQRAILRSLHSDGKHPVLAQEQGFVIEMIPAGDKVIQAFEFYEPAGRFHFYYRFNVFDASGKMERFYALESDDADQAMYAQQHPKEATAGERRFSIDYYEQKKPDSVTQGLVGFIDGQPSYDDLRARIVKLVSTEQPAATATPGTAAPPAQK